MTTGYKGAAIQAFATVSMCRSLSGKEVEVRSDSNPDEVYTVGTGAIERSTPTCTCNSFKYQQGVDKHGACKHIRKVVSAMCGWHSQWNTGERQSSRQEKAQICPRCGGPTVPCRVAV